MSNEPKLYAKRKPWELEPHYSAHVSAMTSEGLHSKSGIAAELAWRDQRIARLLTEVTGLRSLVHIAYEYRNGDRPPDPMTMIDWDHVAKRCLKGHDDE